MQNYNPKKVGERIKSFREAALRSQEEVAAYLKIPRPSVSQIENGQRFLSSIELAKLSELFVVPIDHILLGAGEETKKSQGKNQAKIVKRSKVKTAFKFDESKFKEILLYVLSQTANRPNVGETVLYKLLYFCDFNYYEKYRQPMTGATYIKNHFGPTPTDFKKIVQKNLGKEIAIDKNKYHGFEQTRYLALKAPDLRKINGAEKEVIDDVIARLASMSASQISKYSHDDTPWLTTKNGEVIDYQLVFYRSPGYSVGEYDEL
jgi:transcriptional regulator with XRE-family HTH domain